MTTCPATAESNRIGARGEPDGGGEVSGDEPMAVYNFPCLEQPVPVVV